MLTANCTELKKMISFTISIVYIILQMYKCVCTVSSKINGTLKGVHLSISNLHSKLLSVASNCCLLVPFILLLTVQYMTSP